MYLYVLAIHIVFVISWMAGLFYIVRLFIYHTEANDRPADEKQILQQQFLLMEAKLWHIITIPAMLLSVLAGITMLYLNPGLIHAPWMHVKLTFVFLLLMYHWYCGNILKQLKLGIFKFSSTQLRIWNEVATILLVGIVFTVILKSAVNWIYGMLGLILFSVIIMTAVKVYKKYRNNKSS